jgi:hypothetical protein
VDSIPTKVALGVLGLVPIAAIFAIAIHLVVLTHGRPELLVHVGPLDLPVPDLTIDELVPIAIAVAATALAQMLIAIAFIVHAQKNERLTTNARLVWMLLVVFVGSIADPIYWATQVLHRDARR